MTLNDRSHKKYRVKIVRCTCSKCLGDKKSYTFSWYCDKIGDVYEVDDYEHSPEKFWHIIGKPQQADSGCWIRKYDTEIVVVDDRLPLSLFEI